MKESKRKSLACTCRISRKSRRAEVVPDAEDFVIPAGYVAKVRT